MRKLYHFLFCTWLLFSAIGLSGKTVIVAGSAGEPESLDPAEVWDDSGYPYLGLIFETLVKVDQVSGKTAPCLAISWHSENNARRWVFKLRENVLFHDLSLMGPDAVVFTFKRMLDHNSKYLFKNSPLFNEIFVGLKSLKKLDKNMVVFTLKEQDRFFPLKLSSGCAAIISPASLKKYGDRFRKNPVGTGPFKVISWKKGVRIELGRFKKYWGEKPSYKVYSTLIIPSFKSMLEMFKTGKLDIMYSFSISKMPMLKGLDWTGILEKEDIAIDFIAMNLRKKPLSDFNLRKAMNLLWNRNFLKIVYQGYNTPVSSIIPKGLPGFNTRIIYPYSKNEAVKILKSAGINPGKRIKLKFIIFKDHELGLSLISLYRRSLISAGIDLNIIRVGSEKEYNKLITNGYFDMAYSGWISDYPDSLAFLSPLFSKKLLSQGFPNLYGVDDKEIKNLFIAAKREINIYKRQSILLELNRLILKKALCIPLYQNKSVIIYNKRIGELRISKTGKLDLVHLKIK